AMTRRLPGHHERPHRRGGPVERPQRQPPDRALERELVPCLESRGLVGSRGDDRQVDVLDGIPSDPPHGAHAGAEGEPRDLAGPPSRALPPTPPVAGRSRRPASAGSSPDAAARAAAPTTVSPSPSTSRPFAARTPRTRSTAGLTAPPRAASSSSHVREPSSSG